MTYKTEAEMMAETPRAERMHFMECEECGRWFDMRSLDDTVFHGFGHVERPDIPSAGPGVRMEGRKA